MQNLPTTSPDSEQPLTIADLYPELNSAQQSEAADCLNRYLAVVRRIFTRLENERKTVDK